MMVDLTGELAEEAQEVLNDLHIGIDAGKKIATAAHDFEIKLLAMDKLIMHIQFNYGEHEDLTAFFGEISDEIVQLREGLEVLEKGAIHVVLNEEAADKRGAFWTLRHRKKIEEEVKEEMETDEEKFAREIVKQMAPDESRRRYRKLGEDIFVELAEMAGAPLKMGEDITYI